MERNSSRGSCAGNRAAKPVAQEHEIDSTLSSAQPHIWSHPSRACFKTEHSQSHLEALSRSWSGRGGKSIVYMVSAGHEAELGESVNFGDSSVPFARSAWVQRTRLTPLRGSPQEVLPISFQRQGCERQRCYHGTDGACADIGTSYACPLVSSVVVLVLSANPNSAPPHRWRRRGNRRIPRLRRSTPGRLSSRSLWHRESSVGTSHEGESAFAYWKLMSVAF